MSTCAECRQLIYGSVSIDALADGLNARTLREIGKRRQMRFRGVDAFDLMRRDVRGLHQSVQVGKWCAMPDLDRREILVLALRAQGYGQKAIAERAGFEGKGQAPQMKVRKYLNRLGLPLRSVAAFRRANAEAALNRVKRAANPRNPIEHLPKIMRDRICAALKRVGKRKTERTMELIGCTPHELRRHIESRFSNGMQWGNYGLWHVDHIVPISFFDLTDQAQRRAAFHYTNVQPLWASDNLRKGDKHPSALDYRQALPLPPPAGGNPISFTAGDWVIRPAEENRI